MSPGRFEPPSAAAVLKLVESYPFVWVVSGAAENFAATPLPLRPLLAADGSLCGFLGHFARANPQLAALRREPRAQFLFMGPQGYISPSWFSDRTQAPTWNYAIARFDVALDFLEEPAALRAVIEDLVATMEAGRPKAWSAADMGARYAKLAAHIVGFRASILSQQVKFKLGQDERDDVYREIAAGLEAEGRTDLRQWMAASNPARST